MNRLHLHRASFRVSPGWALVLSFLMILSLQPLWLKPWVAPNERQHGPTYGQLPLAFIPNTGQTDGSVRFQSRNLGASLSFASTEVVLTLPSQRRESPAQILHLHFEQTAPDVRLTGGEPLPGRVNYLLGNDPARWRTNLPTYAGLSYEGLYPGITLQYEGQTAQTNPTFLLKGTYTVAPGADPSLIRWHYRGAVEVRLAPASGDLIISLPDQTRLIEQAPIAWQVLDGQRKAVPTRYTLAASGSVGFAFPQGYDPGRPLIIDPALSFSTYVGGSGHDYGLAIDTDAAGNVYVTGYTLSTDFPAENPYQASHGGLMQDAVLLKLNPTGTNLIYATYLGGNGNDRGWGLVVDQANQVYLTGDTSSTDFPLAQPVQDDFAGGGPFEGDAFVAKLNESGSALLYATYLGGKGDDIGYDLAVDAEGTAYVAGYTSSINFPTWRAIQPDPSFPDGLNVFGDAFVTTVISASGVYTWGYSTYLGGTEWDEARGITVDESGHVYLAGHTRSPDFPTRQAVQPLFGGGSGRGDAFVTTVISASGVYTWGYSTYLGGGGNDWATALALDDSGVYVTGDTASANFPVSNPLQSTYGGDGDAFVTKVVTTTTGYAWGYSTFLGGEETDGGYDLAVDSAGRTYVTGYTRSPYFPVTADALDSTCGTNSTCNNSADGFLIRLNPAGDELEYGTFVGGSATEVSEGLALDAANHVYLTGNTFSEDFPISSGAYDSTCGVDGECSGTLAVDLFVTKIDMNAEAAENSTLFLPLILKSSPPQASCAPYPITTVTVGQTPRGLAFDAARRRLYVANSDSGTVSVIDTGNHTVVGQISGLGTPTMLAHDPTRNMLWVTDTAQNQVIPIEVNDGGTGFTPLSPVVVGAQPWGVVYDPVHDSVLVANSGDDTVSAISAAGRTVHHTFSGDFAQPYHLAVNPTTGQTYVANFGNASVTILAGSTLVGVVDLFDSLEPYGLAVDETRNLIYVSTVASHRIVVIGPAGGSSDQFLGWIALQRGSNPARPVPLRAVALNPTLGPTGDGGHVWAVTSLADGSEANQALLIAKGWSGSFNQPAPSGLSGQPLDGLLVDRSNRRVYITNGTTPGRVTVLGDGETVCLTPFKGLDSIDLTVERPAQ